MGNQRSAAAVILLRRGCYSSPSCHTRTAPPYGCDAVRCLSPRTRLQSGDYDILEDTGEATSLAELDEMKGRLRL